MNLDIGKREYLLDMLHKAYAIPKEYHECVKAGIIKNANKSKSDEVINNLLSKPQSVAQSLSLLRDENFSLMRGKFAEYLACMEYNALKNTGNVLMTIVNPDTSSKADLLHIVKTANGYMCVAGPDIKTGQASYILDMLEKNLKRTYDKNSDQRYEIPIVDFDGHLTTDEGIKALTKAQRKRFDRLKNEFPNKLPIKSVFNGKETTNLMLDYLKYVDDGSTPSYPSNKPFKCTIENRDRIKNEIFNNKDHVELPKGAWDEFNNCCKNISSIDKSYRGTATSEKKREAAEEARQRRKALLDVQKLRESQGINKQSLKEEKADTKANQQSDRQQSNNQQYNNTNTSKRKETQVKKKSNNSILDKAKVWVSAAVEVVLYLGEKALPHVVDITVNKVIPLVANVVVDVICNKKTEETNKYSDYSTEDNSETVTKETVKTSEGKESNITMTGDKKDIDMPFSTRKLQDGHKASEIARENAKTHGADLPDGYTYVRGYTKTVNIKHKEEV